MTNTILTGETGGLSRLPLYNGRLVWR